MSAPWELHRKTLRNLYLERKMKVKDMVAHMRITYGFNASEGEYERQFKTWGFRKNLKKEHWKHIIPQVEKRKREGKESEVKFDGVLVPMEKIQKRASSQYGHTTVWEKAQARLEQENTPPAPEGITIQTPQPRFALCLDTLPWVQFQNLLQAKVSDDEASRNELDFQGISAIVLLFTVHQQHIGAAVPSGKVKQGITNNGNIFQLSSWDVLSLATLFHTNRIIPPFPGTPWINTIIQHSNTVETSSLLQILLATNSPTVDGLSEIVLKEALLYENVEVVRLLLHYSKVDANAMLPGPWPDHISALRYTFMSPRRPIEVAILSQNAQMVQLLLHHHVQVHDMLHIAARHSTIQILEAVIRSGQVNHSAALIELVRLGNVSAVEMFLNSGTSADVCDPESGYTALTCAITVGSLEIIELLINEGADINLPAQCGMTPLHVAIIEDHLEIAKLLLVHLAQIEDPYICTNDRIRIPTPLQTAVYCGNLDVASLLLEYGANVNTLAPKMMNVTEEELDEAQEKRSCWKDLHYVMGANGLNTLEIAFYHQDEDMIELLLDHHVFVGYPSIEPPIDANNERDLSAERSSAMAAALSLDHRDIIRRLVSLGAPVFPDALRAAAETANFEMMQYLLDQGLDVNHIYWDGRTALVSAIKESGWRMASFESLPLELKKVCAFLLERGAEMNCELACESALYAATTLNDMSIVKFLIEEGADLHNDVDGQHVLERAIEKQDLELVRFLVKQGMDVNYRREERHILRGLTPLHCAINTHDINFVRLLVENGAGVNFHIPIEVAIQKRQQDIVRLLIKHGARCDRDIVLCSAAQYCDRDGFEEITIAARSDSPHFDARIRVSCLGHPAFFRAIQRQNRGVIEALLAININLDSPCMHTALTLLCRQENLPMMRLLRSAGAPVDARSVFPCMESVIWPPKSLAPLYSATIMGLKDMVQFLLEQGADPNISLAKQDSILCDVLEKARDNSARQDYLEILDALIKAGFDVNRAASHNHGRTALQKAAELGDGAAVDRLLDAGADVHAPPAKHGGVTALQVAAIGGYLGIAEKFLNIGAYVDAEGAEEEGRTALEGAAEHGRLDMVQLLLNAGAGTSPSTGKQQCENAIKMARDEGHNSVAKLVERHRATNGC